MRSDTHKTSEKISGNRNKFWEEVIAYFLLIQAGEKTKRREIQRQSFRSKDDCMSLLF
jgi:hypothetical protein